MQRLKPTPRTPLASKTNEVTITPQNASPSHYDALSIKKEAGNKTIRKAYYRKARYLHPDKGGNSEDFRNAANAYEVLSSPNKREVYDLEQLMKTLSFEQNNSASSSSASEQQSNRPMTNWDLFLYESNNVFVTENAHDFVWIRPPPSFDPFINHLMTAQQVNGLRIIAMTTERLQAQQLMASTIERWSEMNVINSATNCPSKTFYDGPYKDFRDHYSKGNFAKKLNWILAITYTLRRSLQPISLPIFSLWLDDPTTQKVLSGLGRSWVSLRKKNASKDLRLDEKFSLPGIDALLEDFESSLAEHTLSFKWRE
mmetsp:Transcript_21325/g.32364  ORF Transcript_21325/g.32364 Transcript_21325/m.32364 type:complete len:313 (+) Transcript_21325:31-969(+)